MKFKTLDGKPKISKKVDNGFRLTTTSWAIKGNTNTPTSKNLINFYAIVST